MDQDCYEFGSSFCSVDFSFESYDFQCGSLSPQKLSMDFQNVSHDLQRGNLSSRGNSLDSAYSSHSSQCGSSSSRGNSIDSADVSHDFQCGSLPSHGDSIDSAYNSSHLQCGSSVVLTGVNQNVPSTIPKKRKVQRKRKIVAPNEVESKRSRANTTVSLPTPQSENAKYFLSLMEQVTRDTWDDWRTPNGFIRQQTTVQLKCRQIDATKGDGNCFFRALSKQFHGSETYHLFLRTLIVNLISTNKKAFSKYIDGGNVRTHVIRMIQERSWATTCEIYAAATLFQRDVFVLTPNRLSQKYSWLLFKPVFKMDDQHYNTRSHPCYITLRNTDGNHYDRVLPENGGCNCSLPRPELTGISCTIDLT